MARNLVFLGDVCRGRDNNLNLIRIVAAGSVLVSHAWVITSGHEAAQPLHNLLEFDLGRLAVMTFFAISGFLIARSYERQPTVRQWLAARALRLFPALTVMLLLTALVLGPVFTALPLDAYFSDPRTQSYVPNNLTLALRQADLPGVFASNPWPYETNGSLWSLYYEVLCYGGVLMMGLAGAFRAWKPLIASAAVFVALNAALVLAPVEAFPNGFRTFLSVAMPFACGVAFHVARAWLPLSIWLLAPMALAAYLVRATPLYHPALVLALSYAVFLVAYLPRGRILRYNAVGDYSYGVYIYAWPVQQAVVQGFGPMGPLENIAIAAPITLGLAMLSWKLIEKPALALVRNAGPASRPIQGDQRLSP